MNIPKYIMKKYKTTSDIKVNNLNNYELKSLYNLYVSYEDNSMTEIYLNDIQFIREMFGDLDYDIMLEFIRSKNYSDDEFYVSIDNTFNAVCFTDIYKYLSKINMINKLDSFISKESELVLSVLNEDW